MFNWLYDKATHYCKDCGWDGDGWELKGGRCPSAKVATSKNLKLGMCLIVCWIAYCFASAFKWFRTEQRVSIGGSI